MPRIIRIVNALVYIKLFNPNKWYQSICFVGIVLVNLVCRLNQGEHDDRRREAEGGKIQWARISVLENANGRLPLPKGSLSTPRR